MEKDTKKKTEEAKIERVLRRLLEGMGSALDHRLGRNIEIVGNLTSDVLIQRMKRLMDERVVDRGKQGRFAPHQLKLKVEWGTHSEAPPEMIKELEHEILAAAIDHINDNHYKTMAPVKIETSVDIFTTGILIDPTFGEFEEQLREIPDKTRTGVKEDANETFFTARIVLPGNKYEQRLAFRPGGPRLNIGRASDSHLVLNHPSVSKVHAVMAMNKEGTLLLADTGSTNGTFINGRRIAYGESRQIAEGDVLGFGDIEVRLYKVN
jgi:hypothetical protein